MALKILRFNSQFLKTLTFNLPNPLITTTPQFFCTNSSRSSSNSDKDVEKIFQMIHNCPSTETLKNSLNSTEIHLSNDLIDQVLKRVRFSHTNPNQALDFFKYFDSKKGFYHTQFSLDTMLYILGRGRKFEVMWDVLKETKRKERSLISVRTLNVVLGRVAKVCTVRQTVECFKKFKRLVSDFDVECFNALLRVLCQEKSMVDARNVYHSLKGGFRPNLQTFNILLSGWKSSDETESFFQEMKELNVKPDIVSYNCLIDVYCKSNEVKKAYEMIDRMREDDIYPDVITFTSLIGGLGLSGQPDKAKDILKEMKEYGVYPDVPAYNAAIRNFCIAKRLENAYDLLNEMVGKGLNPNPTSFNLFFRVFYWSNDLKSAWSLYKKMKEDEDGCLPNTQSCMFLIRLCRRQERVEMAFLLWNDMVEKGFGSLVLVSDVLFDLLCDLGKLDEAERCFLEMVEKRQRPSNVAFKRIKVLMELANRKDGLARLEERMEAVFGKQPQFKRPNEDFDDDMSLRCVAR